MAARTPSPFGRVTLVTGPEDLLADRAVADVLARVRAESPEAEVTRVDADRLDGARLAEVTGPSLFATRRAAVVGGLAELDAALHEAALTLAREPQDDLALVLVPGGGAKGKGLLDKLRAAGVDVVDAPAVKAWELPQFVTHELRRARASAETGAAQALVDAVGHDLRALAGAVSQLVADADGPVTEAQVRRYFGGRAEVTSFSVADSALKGQLGPAMEQLRWALSTGVAPVLVTSALASSLRSLGRFVGAPAGMRDADLAREVGVPPWKLKQLRQQARGWDQRGLAGALRVVAVADAEVKGAAEDAGFALERAVLAVARARRG